MCGHVGCGRYIGCGSGVHHHESTGHNFAMELATQRVWDYIGDNYVHRLIQNKVDGKLVELPDSRQGAGSSAEGPGRELDSAAAEVKQRGQEEQYEAVVHEYSLLLTGQLEVSSLPPWRAHPCGAPTRTHRAQAAAVSRMAADAVRRVALRHCAPRLRHAPRSRLSPLWSDAAGAAAPF